MQEKQEMSQQGDECPQRNRSSIRHIRGKLLYAPDTKYLEMRSEVNVKVTQNGMHHSPPPSHFKFGIPTSNNIGNMLKTPFFKKLVHRSLT